MKNISLLFFSFIKVFIYEINEKPKIWGKFIGDFFIHLLIKFKHTLRFEFSFYSRSFSIIFATIKCMFKLINFYPILNEFKKIEKNFNAS